MASFTTAPDQRFRPGTVLNVYPATGGGRPSSGSVTSATVAADSTATFTGLDDASRYVAGTTINGPFITFSTPAVTTSTEGVSVDALETALSDVLETEDGWPERPTLNGETIPWPLRWRSLPGSVVNPSDQMAEFDTYLAVPEDA